MIYILYSMPIITTTVSLIIFVVIYYTFLWEDTSISSIKKTVPNIIQLSKNITYIEDYIKQTIENYEHELIPINSKIDITTELTSSQIQFLNFLKNLEIYQTEWDNYVGKGLISNTDIEMPYRIAHNIREILEVPISDTLDEFGYKNVWITPEEIKCVINYLNKKRDPITPPKNKYGDEHVVICIKCKSHISLLSELDESHNIKAG
jgi:hypothetical protein